MEYSRYMLVRPIITVRVLSSAKDKGLPSMPELEDGLLRAAAGVGAGALERACDGAMSTELLPMKKGMGKSFIILSGFCFRLVDNSSNQVLTEATKSFLQAATACWTVSFFF